MVPAAFAPIAKSYGVSIQKASYLTTSNSIFGGVTPLLMTPFVNIYGRRPAYLVRTLTCSQVVRSCSHSLKLPIQLFTLIAIASNIGSGYATTYPLQILARCVSGIGASVALSIGGATVRFTLF